MEVAIESEIIIIFYHSGWNQSKKELEENSLLGVKVRILKIELIFNLIYKTFTYVYARS